MNPFTAYNMTNLPRPSGVVWKKKDIDAWIAQINPSIKWKIQRYKTKSNQESVDGYLYALLYGHAENRWWTFTTPEKAMEVVDVLSNP